MNSIMYHFEDLGEIEETGEMISYDQLPVELPELRCKKCGKLIDPDNYECYGTLADIEKAKVDGDWLKWGYSL